MHHYVRDTSGNWQKRVSGFSASNVTLTFLGDRLFAFAGRENAEIYYSDRADNFTEWHQVEMPIVDSKFGKIEGGYITWDLSLLNQGVASVIWQHAPGSIGDPSPIYVYDFELGEVSSGE